MSNDKKPKIILDVPSNLKPEDLHKIMPDNGPIPDRYEFLAVEPRFFANDKYVGIDFAWGVKGMGWGHVTLSCAREDHIADVLSIFFHELGHIHNKDLGYFPLYHSMRIWNMSTRPVAFYRTALRAEIFTDKIGAKLQKSYFPDVPFYAGYNHSPKIRKWLNNWLRGDGA